jgi:hypothetical protein
MKMTKTNLGKISPNQTTEKTSGTVKTSNACLWIPTAQLAKTISVSHALKVISNTMESVSTATGASAE